MAKDLTQGSPVRLIFRFALPLLLGNFLQQIYSMVDTLIVGRTIGVHALAGVGATGCMLFLVLGFLMGMTQGFSIVLSQRFGAKDMPGLRRSFCAAILTGLLVAGAVTFLGVRYAKPLLALLNTPADIVACSEAYLTVVMGGSCAAMLYNVLASAITALGDSRTPLFFLAISCIVNIILDFAFILGLGMGVEGAALATVCSQGFSALLCLGFIIAKVPLLRPRKGDWRHLSPRIFARLVGMGAPMGFQTSVIALGAVAVQAALNGLGSDPVAAVTAAMRVDAFAVMPLMSFGHAMATYTGQNFGAGRLDRIRLGVKQGSLLAIGYACLAALLLVCFGPALMHCFVGPGQEHVVALGWRFMTIQAGMYWVLALLFILRSTLQGIGQSFVPTMAGLSELAMRVFAAFWLVERAGFDGICWASPLAWFGSFVPLAIAWLCWLRGQRRQTQLPAGA